VWRVGARQHGTRYRWWVLTILVLSFLPVRPMSVRPVTFSANQSEQHETPDGKLYEEAKLHAGRPRLRPRRLGLLLPTSGGVLPSRPARVHPMRLESLVHEDPRRVLLPRWTAPPEPDEHA
jgi:hypothetical protein